MSNVESITATTPDASHAGANGAHGDGLALRLTQKAAGLFSGTHYTGYFLVAPTVLFLAVSFLWPVLLMIFLQPQRP
ncbi:hypothetical protein [Agrobacterium radiobacter]|uniref:hypothetical protein n=1 Tax=Agrobacterium radiobacter TaxID=362 RepID=UPI003CE47B0D